MRFESKARNLQNLIGKLKSAKILPLIIINKDDINKTNTINKIIAQGWENMIVRSSAKCEDSTTSSHAGEFLSIQNISQKTLLKALNEVAKSLPGDDDEIFIQPMCDKLDNFVVAMSASQGANYVSINIDNSGDSSSITNGMMSIFLCGTGAPTHATLIISSSTIGVLSIVLNTPGRTLFTTQTFSVDFPVIRIMPFLVVSV